MRQLETEDGAIELIASVVMPDHIHVLFRITDASELAKIMQRFRGRTSQLVNQQLRRTGPVWQRGYFERRLRLDEPLAPILHYMWHNPTPPGTRFRCRTDTWDWFRTTIDQPHPYADWLAEQV